MNVVPAHEGSASNEIEISHGRGCRSKHAEVASQWGRWLIDWLAAHDFSRSSCKANRGHEMRSQVKTYSNDFPSHMSGGVDNNRRLPSNLK